MSKSKTHSANRWRWETLESIAVDGAPVLYGILQPGPDLADGIPYVRPTEIVEDVIDLASIRRTSPLIAAKYKRSVLKPNDIILSIVGTIGKVALVPPDLDGGNITQSSVRIRVRPEIASSRFIAWALRSPLLTRQFDKYRLGTAVPRLNVAHVRSLRVPIPSLDEQQQIVAEIEKQFTRLEAGVAGLRRVQANLKRYRAAVLKAACEGKLVPTEAELARQESRSYETGAQLLDRILTERREKWNGKGKYKEPAKPDTTNLPPLSEGWMWATFDQLTTLITKGSSPNWQGFQYCDQGMVFVRSENVRWGKLNLTDVAHLPRLFNDKEKKSILREGDVLLNLVGASIGRAAVATSAVEGGNVNQAVAVIRLVHSEIMNRFITSWLISAEAQKRIHAEKVDVARANFSLEDTRVLPVPLPTLAEQQRIVAEVERRLSVVEELETFVNANLRRATRLRQSILQRAFQGKLIGSENHILPSESKQIKFRWSN